jgi:hypothetical protein
MPSYGDREYASMQHLRVSSTVSQSVIFSMIPHTDVNLQIPYLGGLLYQAKSDGKYSKISRAERAHELR